MNNKLAFVAISISSFLVPFVGSSLTLALPHIAEDLHMNAVLVSFVVSAYLLPCAMFQMPFARIADKIGRKKVYLTGILTFSFFSLMAGLAWSPWSLLLFRALTAIGSAMMFGTAMAILVALFPAEMRGRILGLNTAVVYFALASGPFFGGMLSHWLGWRSILFFSAAMGAVAIIASSLAIKREWRVEVNERFDILGAIYYALSIFCVIYGFSLIPNPKSWPLFLFGAFMVVMFIRHENRNSDPLFNLRLFSSNYNFRMSTVASMLNYAVTGALTFILSLYLQTVRGLDAQDAGMLLMIQPIAQTVLSVYSGRLSDKMNPAILATAGMAVICVGMVGLCFVGETTPWWFFVSIILCFGVGFGTFSSPNVNLIMSSVEKQYYGTASAVTGTARQIGQSFSIGIATLCLHIYLGNNIISPANRDDFMSSFHLTCVISLVMCVIGVYASATRIWRGNS